MSKPTILAVDDEYANRFLLENTLTDYRVVLVDSAEAMRNHLNSAEQRPDLILLDIMMPRESGFEAAEKLSSDESYSDIPIVFLSARTSGDDVARGLEVGGEDYVKKPFDEKELKARIRTVLERSAEQKKLFRGASYDELTGTFRREVFLANAHARFQFAQRKEKPFALALLDVDNFKRINDQYGHQAGDEVLSRLGADMSRDLREYDLIGRYGGEEFVLALLEEDKHRASSMMERLREQISKRPIDYEGNRIEITVSVGVADSSELPEADDGLDALIRLADERLYRAKALGKDQVRID